MRALTAPRLARLAALAVLLGGCALGVQAEDLPGSAACRVALQALNDAQDAAAASAAASAVDVTDDRHRRDVAARLFPLRQRVADACLGGMTTSAPPSRQTWTGPLPGRPGVPATPAARAPQMAVPAVAVPLPRIEPPVTLQHCTGASCLASDGSTLTRVSPTTLVGPRGLCTVVGGVLRCP